MGHLWHDVMRVINSLDREEWALVLAGMIIVGFFCLRGLGSRLR